MDNLPQYSVIIPVYNRPDEMDELLASLVKQTFSNFEVIVIEDGSINDSRHLVEKYSNELQLEYFFKSNSGPGPSRNLGFEKAKGNYFVVFDSDCLLPTTYFESVEKFLGHTKLDAWGGPDRGHETFTTLQRAMAHTMSSFFTTGGIRGAKKIIGSFQPRSFNMGISKATFQQTGGFLFARYAEDIELSIRMKKLDLHVGFIEEAFVYHKRRATLGQFFRQVFNFGRGRVLVGLRHPGEVKLVHWFPAIFLLGFTLMLLISFFFKDIAYLMALGYSLYLTLIAWDGLIKTKSLLVALLSIPSAIVQLTGYGLGFLLEKKNSLHDRSNSKGN